MLLVSPTATHIHLNTHIYIYEYIATSVHKRIHLYTCTSIHMQIYAYTSTYSQYIYTYVQLDINKHDAFTNLYICSERHSSQCNVLWRNGLPRVVLKAREIACRLWRCHIAPAKPNGPIPFDLNDKRCNLTGQIVFSICHRAHTDLYRVYNGSIPGPARPGTELSVLIQF